MNLRLRISITGAYFTEEKVPNVEKRPKRLVALPVQVR